jgi:small subunit ribosomal protein S6
MREYETVVITKPDLPESQQRQINDRLKTLIEKHQGRLFFARNMGRRSLAYSIKKCTKGVYTCFDYAAVGTAVSELERSMRLDEDVLRFLTVVRHEEIDVEARAAEIVARGEDVAQIPAETEMAASARPQDVRSEAKGDDESADVEAEEVK